MSKFTPFADDAGSTSIGKLTTENGTDRIALYGSLDLTRDRLGLAHARALRAILDQTVQALEAQADLADAVPPATSSRTVTNPFD